MNHPWPLEPDLVDRRVLDVFIDGAGCRPDGTGSGYAFLIVGTGQERVKRIDGLTNNAAEYRGLRYALLNLRVGSSADVFSDSQLLVNQFSGEWAVRDPSLARLLRRIHEIIEERQLKLTLSWIPREQNLAGKLLERGYRSSQGRAQNKLQKLHL